MGQKRSLSHQGAEWWLSGCMNMAILHLIIFILILIIIILSYLHLIIVTVIVSSSSSFVIIVVIVIVIVIIVWMNEYDNDCHVYHHYHLGDHQLHSDCWCWWARWAMNMVIIIFHFHPLTWLRYGLKRKTNKYNVNINTPFG